MIRAADCTVDALEQRMMLTVKVLVPTWVEQGPGPLTNATATNIPAQTSPAGGAVEAIATPPNNANIVFLGAVNGGVWRATNAAQLNPTWTPVTEKLQLESIGAVALSHFDADGNKITATTPIASLPLNKVVVYAGAGRFSSAYHYGTQRSGVYKSVDGGNHWAPLDLQLQGVDIRAIVPSETDPNVVLVAARKTGSRRGGVYVSTDGGKTFTHTFAADVTSLISDPANANRYYVGVPGKGIYRSDNGGAHGTWNLMNTGLDVILGNNNDDDRDGVADTPAMPDADESVAGSTRIELSLRNGVGGNVVYADLIGGNNKLMGVYRSTNAASTWSLIANLPDLTPGGQGFVHTAILADPNDAGAVYVSGDRLAGGVVATIYRADVTPASGPSPAWEQIVQTGAGNTAPHADSRDLALDASGNLLYASDGGLYRLNSPTVPTSRAWVSLNSGLRALEFWSTSYDTVNQTIFGGAQDNGLAEQPKGAAAGAFQWNGTAIGDGLITQVVNSGTQSTHYIASQNLNQFRRQVFNNSGNPVGSATFPALTVVGTTANWKLNGKLLPNTNRAFDPTLPFVTQYAVNPLNPQQIMFGSQYLYESFDGGATVVPVRGLTAAQTPANAIGQVTAIAYGGKTPSGNLQDGAYIAAGGHNFYVRTTIRTGGTNVRTMPTFVDYSNRATVLADPKIKAGQILDIATDPSDFNDGFVIDDKGGVFYFQNGGATVADWQRINGSDPKTTLGRMVTDLRTIEVIRDPTLGEIVLVGGQGGVYATLNPLAGTGAAWVKVGTGLPRVIVEDMHYAAVAAPNDALVVGTFGRGTWKINNFVASFAKSVPSAPVGVDGGGVALPAAAGDPGVLSITGDDLANKNDTIRLVLDPANSDVLQVYVNNTTTTPDFDIDATSIRQVFVTGGAGDDTLIVDDANGQVTFPGGITFDQTGPGTNVQQEINQTPIDGGVAAKIRSGIQGIADLSAKIGRLGELAEQIPGLGMSLGQALSLGDGSDPIGGIIKRGLVDPINNFFSTDVTPTVQELTNLIKTLSAPLGNVSFGIDPLSVSGGIFTGPDGHQELRFGLDLSISSLIANLSLDFKGALSSLGLTFDSSGTVDLSAGVDLNFEFGVDLSPGLSDDDAFFIRTDGLKATARVSAGEEPEEPPNSEGPQDQFTGKPLNFGVNVGFLSARVVDGSINLEVDADATLVNPDDDPAERITLAELKGTSLSSLVDFEAEAKLGADLPVEVTLAGLTATAPIIHIASDDLFEHAPTVSVENFDNLLNFNNVSALSILGLLKQVGTFLERFKGSAALSTKIPFTSKTVGDILDLGNAFTDKLYKFLEPQPGKPAFDSAEGLANLLATTLGISPATVGAQYDAATNALTFHVKLSDGFAPQTLPVDLGLSLGSLAGLSTSSTLGVSATAGIEFTFGVILSPPGATITGTTDAPANGRLSGPAHFSVQVGGDDAVDVTVPADATNNTIDDLVADLNAALQAAGLGDTVKAGRSGNKITFATQGLTTSPSLTISSTGGDVAETQLGLSDSQSATDTLGSRFFIKDASVTGSAALTATDIDANAHLGFLGVGVVNGTGGITASFNAALTDPGTGANADGRITLAELFDALSNDVSKVAPTPTLSGSANLTLPLQVTPNILGAGAPPAPAATVTWTDIKDPSTLNVSFNADTSRLLDFQNISFAGVLQAILQGVQYVASLEKFSFLGQKLPLLNKSVSELIGAADQLLAKVNAAAMATPADTLQTLANVLNSALGLPANSINLTIDGKAIKVGLAFHAGGTQQIPIDLDLATLAAGVPGLSKAVSLLDVGGTGNLTVGADADVNLNIGVDITSPTSPRPFLYDDSSIHFDAKALGANLNFTAAVGPLGLFIKNGTVNLDGDGNPNTPDSANFTVGITDDNHDGRHYFDELDTGDVHMALVGQAHATLPLFFPTSGQSIGNLAISISDLSNISGTTTVTTPNLDAQFNAVDLLGNVGAMVDGLDLLLGKLQDGMDGQVFGRKLPLIGNHLKDGARFIEDIRTKAIEPLRNTLQDKPPADALKNALFSALGPSGLGLLGDLDNNGTIDLNDVGVALDSTGNQIIFNTRLHQAPTALDVPLGFDIGLPGLGLEVDGGVQANVGFDFRLSFGLNKTDGFFFVTDTKDGSGNQIPELSVNVDATTPDLSATGRLAILQLKATDSTTNPTHLGANFSVDLKDPNNDGKLTAAELAAGPALSDIIKAKLTAAANINLHLVASFGAGANFPTISTDFGLNWSFTNAPTDAPDASFGNKPSVSFTNVQLNAGEFFSNFAKPILDNVQKVLKPIQPVIDILTAPLPVLSDIKAARNLLDFDHSGSVTLLDLVHLYNPNAKLDFITSLAKTIDLINAIPTGVQNLSLNLGHFDIGADLRTATAGLKDTDLANVVQQDTNSQLTGAAANFKTKLADLNAVPGGGIAFPLLQSPSSVFKLLIGQDVNLFTYDMPTLQATFEISEFFPIIGPLGARFTGSIGAAAHFGFGYDTTGLREYFDAPSGQRQLSSLLDGLFVSDRKNADGTGAEVPEVTLTGSIEAAAELNLGIASAGVSGGIFANIGFDLDDPNNDGKMRLNEIVAQLQRGPMCLFDVHGEIDAGLSAYIKFLFSKKTFNIAKVKLLDFNYSCPAVPEDPDPILATVLPGGVLRLNVGPSAAARQYGDLTDGDETLTVSPGATPGTITVEGMGFKQDYTGVSSIVADGGAGNDNLLVKAGVTVPVNFTGGVGDDSLYGGSGDATLTGGVGNDQLSGGTGNDCISGGDGDDILLGGQGNDRIDGGLGADTEEGGDGNDVMTGGAGQDVLSGGTGDDSLDGGDDNDDLSGGDGADVLTAGLGDDALDGEAGNDLLQAGDGKDMIAGGAGNDTAFGGAGDDTFDGGTGNDQLFGEDGNDSITGGAGNDSITGDAGADVIDAGAGNDSITAGTGDDRIDAGDGNDFVDAGDGNDSVTGGAGSETIYGGLGADLIFAGLNAEGGGSAADTHLIYGDNPGTGAGGLGDVISGDAGNDEIHGGGGADVIAGLDGNDALFGDDGNDSITGGAGNDTIGGGADDDNLSGQEGDDAVAGDAGIDVITGDAGSDLLWGGAAAFDRQTFTAAGFAADGVTPLILKGATLDGLATDGRDFITGGVGNDFLFGGGDSDQLFGGADNDYLDAGAGNDTALGDAGNDVVRGGGNDDLVRGGTGIDQVYGDDGDDQLYGDAGDAAGSVAGQRLFGGAGRDALYAYAATTTAAEFNLVGDELHGGDDNDSLNGNLRKEKLFGDAGNDLVFGDILSGPLYATNPLPATSGGADQLFGGTGQDQLFGGGGNDTEFGGGDSDRLEGQDGADSLYGGSDIDVIVLDTDISYTTAGDAFDGHFGNDAPGDVPDDNATDILLIQGTSGDDTIQVGESAGQLRINYNGRILPATWRGASGPLVEQFRISGLLGNDRLEFLSGGTTGIDVSALSARSTDFVGVIDGGPGNDSIIGTGGRDRLDGGRGSDLLQGLGGDDRLLGDGGAGQGDPTDFDQLFGGQGNDDLIGGQGTNNLYAWSQDPTLGTQFGVFVDPLTGALHTDDGGGRFALEDTGMNRMLGGAKNDKLFGGTGLDFMYGNGGQDTLFDRNGTSLDNFDDNGVAGQQWKDYARSTGKVWYVGGSNLDDVITVDFVTEPGFLAGHHLVTRLTNNNGNFTFAAQAQLDFEAHNPDGSLVWDPTRAVFDPATLHYDDPAAYARLLPPEGDFQAIIIDALDGNDSVTVGPTVTKSVWIDGGAGADRVTIKSGNPILPDQVEGPNRNDTRANAYNFTTDARVGPITANKVLTGMTLDSPTDVDFYRFRLAAAIQGNLVVSGLGATDGLVLQILDAAGTLLRTSTGGVLSLSGLAPSTDFFLRVNSNLVPTIYQLAFAPTATPTNVNVSTQAPILRRDIIVGGTGDDVLSGGSGEDWILGGDGNDVLSGGLDRQASDLLFGEAGDDTFQVIPDQLPTIPGSDRTIVPTLTDALDGGAGNDRVLFLGGDKDRNSKPVPDTVAIRYNLQLHRYELTTLIWDINNQRYETDATGAPKQLFAYYQAHAVERTVIDTRAGDDEVHADPGYTLGGMTYGINPGDKQQNAQIASLQILGGDGNDRLFGGAFDDLIDGGAGLDFISGGPGNDTVTGGADNDVIAGNVAVAPDRFESVTRNGASSHNDDPAFAANLGKVTPGQVIAGLTLNLGDAGDWYIIPTPDALLRLGTSQAAYLTSDLISVTRSDSGPIKFFLFAARQADPTDPTSILPVERPTGVPAYYMLHVVRAVAPDGTTPAEVPGAYSITFSPNLGKSVHVPPTQADFTINSANPGDQPAVIPLGDINGDGRVDFIGAVQDYSGGLGDYRNVSNFIDFPGNSADLLKPSFARVYFGGTSIGNATLPANAVTLKLPAPVGAPSYFGSQTIFANPADYNGDGISDIAVAVTLNSKYFGNEAPFWNEGVYIIFGRAAGFTGVIDVVRDADVTIRGFAPASANIPDSRLSIAAADVNNDGFDDLLVGNRAAGASQQGAAYVFLGRSKTAWNASTNRVVFSADFSDTSGAPSADGFAIDNTGVTTAGLWHVSTGENALPGHTPGGAMYFGTGETATTPGNYDGVDRAGRITSPVFSLTNLASATLSFNYLLATEPLTGTAFDRARVLISTNGGVSFVPLQVKNADGSLRDAGAANRVPVNGGKVTQPGFLTDPTTGWTNATFDLSAYVGNASVQLRFDWTNNTAANAYEGWYVDDVTVTGAALAPANANVTYTGSAASEQVGSAVSGIGDFNKDGKKDFAIMAAGVDNTAPGQAYVIFGRGTSDAAFTSGPASNAAAFTLRGDASFSNYGIRPAGDVDGDGFAEFLITPAGGAQFLSGFGQPPPPISLVFGRAGLTGVNTLSALSGVLRTSRDGGWVSLGDVNGDGFTDLGANSIRVTAPLSESTSSLTQIRHTVGEIFFGRPNARNTLSLDTPDLVIEPAKPNYDSPGFRPNVFNSPGDINKDGKADVVLADAFGGFSRVYLGQALLPAVAGSSGGGVTLPSDDFQLPLADPSAGPPPANPPGLNLATSGPNPDVGNAFEIHGSQAGEHLSAPRAAGDVNGDGIDDLIVDGTLHSYIILGPANVTGRLDVLARANIIIDHADGTTTAQRFGDVNADGIDDVILVRSAPNASDNTLYDVTVGVVFGGPSLPHRLTLASANRSVTFANGLRFDAGLSTANARQITVSALTFNDDKNDDLLIVPRFQTDAAAYVVSGKDLMNDPDGVVRLGESTPFGNVIPYLTISRDSSTTRDQVQQQLFGPRAGGYTGSSKQDLSAVVAGDVNGDGLDDLVIADKGFAVDDHGAPPVGRAYLFLGTHDNSYPERQSFRSLDGANRIYQAAWLGENVSATGDVNGDGYADFAVGRTREGGSLAPSSLLFFYGRPTIAGPLAAADAAANQSLKKVGDPSSSIFLDGALWSTTGDFNGDGKLDLAVGEPQRTVLNAQNVVLDVNKRGTVYVFFSIATRPTGLSLATADRVINGAGEFDQFGVLSPTGPIDLDRDHVNDLLIGAPGADVVSPSLTAGGGKVYVVYDGVVAPVAPPGAAVGTLTNVTVTGDGDFVVDPGTHQSIPFKDTAPGSTTYTLPAGQTEKWYQFTTLGDGQAGNAIRLTPDARERQTTLVHGKDTGATAPTLTTSPADPTIRVDGFTALQPGTPPSPVGQTVDHMFDGLTNKYVNNTLFSSGAIVTPRANSGLGTVVNGIRFFTADGNPERDPTSYSLEGTNDDPANGGATWTPITGAALNLPAGRNPSGLAIDPTTQFNQTLFFFNTTPYKSYRIKFQDFKNSPPATAAQIGEVQLLSDTSTSRVGGATSATGVFEFDLSQYLRYAANPSLIENVSLQLDYQNATIVAGQKLRVFIGNARSDGLVTPADSTAPATLAGERTFLASDAASGLFQIDITAAVRAAVAAGKNHIMLRLASTSTAVSLDVRSASTASRQTGLSVTTARQHGVVGDLLDPAGNVLAKGLSVISLQPFKAGTFFLHVYDPFGPAPAAIPFSIDMTVPAAGESHADPDRDQLSGGDGDDTVTGNGGLDRDYGNSGNDAYVGDDVEGIDQTPGENTQTPPGSQSSNIPVPDPDPVVTIPDPGLRAVIADALGIGHTAASTGFTRPFFASELAQIRELDASNRQISDLTGLERLTNLETLNLSHNVLSRLDFVDATTAHHGLLGLTRLTALDLGFNRLGDAALATLAPLAPSLRSLTLDANPIRSLAPLAPLTGLTSLSLDGAPAAFSLLPGTTRNNDLLARFANPTPAVGDQMGGAVVQVGDDIAVADPLDDANGTDAGAVYVFDGATGQLLQTLRGLAAGDHFGAALSSFGDLLFVGAPFAKGYDSASAPNSGTVYIVDAPSGRSLGQFVVPNANGGEQFGSAIAVVGSDIVVGAPNDNPFFTGASGGVYTFDIATRRSKGQFYTSQSVTGDRFGASVAGIGNLLFIGAPGRDVGANADVGLVYLANADTQGIFAATIANPINAAGANFGAALVTLGNTLAVGAPLAKAGAGVVHLFDATTDALLRSIDVPGAPGTPDNFGAALANFNDTFLAIGSPAASPNGVSRAGAVYLVDPTTGNTIQTINGTTVNGALGSAVAPAGGDLLVGAIGATGELPSGISSGAATLVKGPRVSDLSPLAALTSLKSLSLANDRIASLAPLASLTNLERLNLQGNQITGNLTPLLSLNKLLTLALNRNPLDNASFTTSIPALTAKLADFSFDPNQAPVIPFIAPIATTAGASSIVFNVNLTDPDAGDATFLLSATSDNPNVTVTLVGNQLTIVPPAAGNPFTGVAHITLTATDGPSGALDWRGRTTTRTFDVNVGTVAISGSKFNDNNHNSFREPGETGVPDWTIFLDANNNGTLDAGETSTTTDADGNYAFSNLAPGVYNVAEVNKTPWFPTTPRTALTANFTAGAQGFTTSGATDPWHITTRHNTDPGHTAGNSFYFGNETTGLYDNATSGILTSPSIDLRNVAGPVTLSFNHNLTTARGTTTLASADFTTLPLGTVGSLDGYTLTGATSQWHVSAGRGTQAGHSRSFSLYFGSGETAAGGGTYAGSAVGFATSPVIDLTGATGTVTLNMTYFLNAAGGTIFGGSGDAAAITVIAAGGARTIIAQNGATKARLLNTTAWTPLALDLTRFAGQQIRLEFGFAGDGDRSVGEGWYVDDVTVSTAAVDVAAVGVLANGVFTPLADNATLANLPDNTGGFVPVSLDLSAFDGQQIQIQYRFTANAAGNAEGWYIDDPRVFIGTPTTVTLAAGQTATGIDFGGIMVASAGPDATVTTGQPVNITATVQDQNPLDGSNFTYLWSVTSSTGQSIPTATTPTFSFTPNTPGTYTVSLTVTDLDDNSRVYTDTAVYTATGDPAGLVASSGSTYTITGPANAPILNVLTGNVTITPQLYAAFPNLAATVAASSTLTLSGSQHLKSLTLASGATATVAGGSTLTLDALSLTGAARLDLGAGFLIYNYAPGQGAAAQALIASLLKTGYSAGHWNGAGIDSSTAAATSGRAVGYLNNNNGTGGALKSTFGGQSAGPNAILARFTLNADANLDGTTDFNDLVALAQHYNQPATSWSAADFNFDNVADFNDLVSLAQNYNQALGAPAFPAAFLEALATAARTQTPTTPPATPTKPTTTKPTTPFAAQPKPTPVARPTPAKPAAAPAPKPASPFSNTTIPPKKATTAPKPAAKSVAPTPAKPPAPAAPKPTKHDRDPVFK